MKIAFWAPGIGEAFFKDGYPTDNHDNSATDNAREEQDFDQAHR
jgi:hypothetical protein